MATLLGGSEDDWLLILLKELLDNSLDASEQITDSPLIEFSIDNEGTLALSDNGPGLPAPVINGALDYNIRISDKNGRIAPSRGQLGNALKCLFAVPLIINGETHIEIVSQKLHHDIRMTFDLSGAPVIDAQVRNTDSVQNGCFFKIHNFFKSRFYETEDGEKSLECATEINNLVLCFSAVNSHTTFIFDIMDKRSIIARSGNITRWTANNPLVAHWHDSEQFTTLLRLTYQNVGNITVNQFISDFKWLTRTDKQKSICDSLGINSVDGIESILMIDGLSSSLLSEMQEYSKPVKSSALGYLNKEHVLDRRASSEKIGHRKASGETTAGRPFTLDVFFEQLKMDIGRNVDIALNNSSLIDGYIIGLNNIFDDCEIDYDDPVWILIHINTPDIEFQSKGKNSVHLDENIMDALSSKLRTVSAEWTKYKKEMARNEARAGRAREEREAARKNALKEESVLPAPADIEGLKKLSEILKNIQADLDFKSGVRGWCYLLEEYIGLSKSDFKKAESRISLCRKKGFLPWDFTAADSNRAMICGDYDKDSDSPEHYVESVLSSMQSEYLSYHPVNLHDFLDYSIVVAVEKIELVELFRPVCNRFHVPLFNCKGWSDINSRCSLLIYFEEMRKQGKKCVFLYCGDHDPGGLRISQTFKNNLRQIERAVGFKSDFVTVERFGLNLGFIEKHKLSWVPNLDTSNPNTPPLNDPRHADHNKPYVQDYIKDFGVRKCEANSLVVRHEAGRQLLTDTILKYINPEQIGEYERALAVEQEKVRDLIKDRFAA